MNSDIVTTAIGVFVFAINCALLFQLFQSRYDLRLSVGVMVVLTAVHIAYIFRFTPVSFNYGGLRGVLYFPVLLFLLKGPLFQKLFGFSLELVLTVSFFFLIDIAAGHFAGYESLRYDVARLVASLVVYGTYFALATRRRRLIYDKLFAYGQTAEWALYSFVGLCSFGVMAVSRMTQTDTFYFIVILFFILLSFGVLCFAIVNTHEKTRRQYEAEFAQSIVSSGREHYLKMDEMHETLRILRHDYKYHLSVIGELLTSGDKDGINRYLTGIQTQLSKSELQTFCSNSVINALLVSYAERCERSGIAFSAEVSLPKSLSIPNYDLCIVLGNLLENAVEACLRYTRDRKIELILKPLGTQLAIRVQNGFDGRISLNEERPKSQKKDGGFGLRSVEAVAARYGGELLLDWNEEVFSAYVTLRL